jgi:Ca2+-binding RTX toxin-like protein
MKGRAGDDQLDGGRGRDRLWGTDGDDLIRGGIGRDRLKGGPDRDRILGGPANDRIYARDGERDDVNCGGGTGDVVFVDRLDKVAGCEHVHLRPGH